MKMHMLIDQMVELIDYIDIYNNTQLISIIDYYERNRDISYI